MPVEKLVVACIPASTPGGAGADEAIHADAEGSTNTPHSELFFAHTKTTLSLRQDPSQNTQLHTIRPYPAI